MTFEECEYKLRIEAAKIMQANAGHDSWAVIEKARRDGITFDAALAMMPRDNLLHKEKRSVQPDTKNKLTSLSPHARSNTARDAAKKIHELLEAADAQLSKGDAARLREGVERFLFRSLTS